MMMLSFWFLLSLLVALLVGFASGRRMGFRSGLNEGRALARIELREQSLRRGVCPICDRADR